MDRFSHIVFQNWNILFWGKIHQRLLKKKVLDFENLAGMR